MQVTQKITEELSSLSVLVPQVSVELFLKDLLGLSTTALKKFSFSKKFLSLKAERGMVLELPFNTLNRGAIFPEYIGPSMKVLFEDDLLLALDKAPFIHTHPLSYFEKDNCLSFLRATRTDQILEVNSSHYDRGLLYRLDYETSGVLIYVKDEVLHQNLRENFSTLVKEKIYHCVVKGEFKKEGKHEHLFSASGERGHKILCVPAQMAQSKKDWQKGELKVRCLKYDQTKNESLLEVTLYTGLRHQIRAQLASLGFPLIGDELYGGEKHERLCLHAQSYSLEWKNHRYLIESQSPWA